MKTYSIRLPNVFKQKIFTSGIQKIPNLFLHASLQGTLNDGEWPFCLD